MTDMADQLRELRAENARLAALHREQHGGYDMSHTGANATLVDNTSLASLREKAGKLEEQLLQSGTPLDTDWLDSALNCLPGRGYVLTPWLSIFNSRNGFCLVAGKDGANDSDESFPIMTLSTRGHVLSLFSIMGIVPKYEHDAMCGNGE